MDIHDYRFLCIRMKPYKSVCCLSLRTCVIIMGLIDFCVGVRSLFKLISLLMNNEIDELSYPNILKAVSRFVTCLSIIFAFNGVRATILLKYWYLYVYSLYKQIQFLILITTSILFEIQYQLSEKEYKKKNDWGSIAYVVVSNMGIYFVAKIVWSSYVHIKKGDTFLVIEGN